MATTSERAARIKSNLIDHITRVDLRVRDVAGALDFYRDVVGLEVAERGGGRASLRAPGGPEILTLDSTGVTAPADPSTTGLFHTAIRFPTRASLGDALARLVAARVEIGAGDHIVSEALYVDDADGNGVELYWDRPVETWPPPTADAVIPMATLPVDLDDLYRNRTAGGGAEQTAPEDTDIGHVHLQVSNVEETIRFFRDVIGLDLTARMGSSAAFFSSKGYHHNIGANSWRSRGAKPAGKERAGLERVVFGVADPAEMDALRARLGAPRDGGAVVVNDPDGIELHFVPA